MMKDTSFLYRNDGCVRFVWRVEDLKKMLNFSFNCPYRSRSYIQLNQMYGTSNSTYVAVVVGLKANLLRVSHVS